MPTWPLDESDFVTQNRDCSDCVGSKGSVKITNAPFVLAAPGFLILKCLQGLWLRV